MRQGWESEAHNWAHFARTPGLDSAHEEINLPALLGLLPPPGRRTLDLACGEGRLGRLLASLGHRVVGIDASRSGRPITSSPAIRAPGAGSGSRCSCTCGR